MRQRLKIHPKMFKTKFCSFYSNVFLKFLTPDQPINSSPLTKGTDDHSHIVPNFPGALPFPQLEGVSL